MAARYSWTICFSDTIISLIHNLYCRYFMSTPQVDVSSLDLCHLAFFLGHRANELISEQLAREGYEDVRIAHGYVFQHLIDNPLTASALAARMGISQQAGS